MASRPKPEPEKLIQALTVPPHRRHLAFVIVSLLSSQELGYENKILIIDTIHTVWHRVASVIDGKSQLGILGPGTAEFTELGLVDLDM